VTFLLSNARKFHVVLKTWKCRCSMINKENSLKFSISKLKKKGKIDIREHLVVSTPLFLPSKISMSNRAERHASHELHY